MSECELQISKTSPDKSVSQKSGNYIILNNGQYTVQEGCLPTLITACPNANWQANNCYLESTFQSSSPFIHEQSVQ